MKMKSKLSLSFLAITAFLLSFTSCNEAEDTLIWSNIVTYQGTQSNGYSRVTWQAAMDSQPIELLIGYDLSALQSGAPTPVGTRIFIEFTTDISVKTLTDGLMVTRDQISSLFVVKTLTPQTSSQLPPENWNAEPNQFIATIYRSGSYLNMSSLLPLGTVSDQMTMTFYVDPQTIGQENVVAYLSYTNPAAYSGATLANTYLNCVDISSLMNGKSSTLTVNFKNENTSINVNVPYGTVASDYQSVTIPLK
ncbi:MAG: hypothetical protein J1E38_01685 [Paramuribaculum sp.]|nr:hypothetical protein [Paramuribaculum sp.]